MPDDRSGVVGPARGIRLLAASFVACFAFLAPGAAAPPPRPHVLFIHADDLGWSDLGCYGARYQATPAIDALAREGLRFTQAYAGAPICTPSRAALITGRHAARLHLTGQPGYKAEDTSARKFAHPDFRTTLPTGTPTVARTLAAAGYRTVLLGKWGFDDDPGAHGFTEVISGPDEALVESAAELFGRSGDSPFFAYLNFSRPHVPLEVEAGRRAAFARQPAFADGTLNPAYAAELEAMDQATGRLLAALDRAGLAQDTVVIFTSDNGGFLGDPHERITDNSPLREGKASLHEGGIRVPLIVRWPGVTPAAATSDALVHWTDWHATLAALAGAPAPGGLDGGSFAAVLRGGAPPPPRPLYWHYPHYRRALPGLAASPSSAVRDGDWKLIHFYETDAAVLYNLRDDPGEARDLAATRPEIAARLRHDLDAWRAAVGAQPPVPQGSR